MRTILIFLAAMLSLNIFAQKGWKFQNPDLTTNESGAISALNKDTVFVIADKGIFIKTFDGGSTWIHFNTGFTESFYDIAFLNSDIGYCVGQKGKIIKTTDGGANWTLSETAVAKNLFSICVKAADEIWVVGDSGLILKSTDYGLSWDKNSLIDKRLNSIGFKGNTGIITGNDGTFLKSINNGANWTLENPVTTKDIFSVCLTPDYTYALSGWVSDESDYAYSFSAEEIIKTKDFINWQTTNLFSSFGVSKMVFVNDSVGFDLVSFCTTNGDCRILINKTSDSAVSWNASLNISPPEWPGMNYSDFSVVNDTIVYALCGNNILKTMDGGIFVSINENIKSSNIKMYPNPLNSSILNFEQDNNMETEVEIFDFSGKLLVKSILNGRKAIMNLADLNNGIYLLKLFQGSRQLETKKLVISRKVQ